MKLYKGGQLLFVEGGGAQFPPEIPSRLALKASVFSGIKEHADKRSAGRPLFVYPLDCGPGALWGPRFKMLTC